MARHNESNPLPDRAAVTISLLCIVHCLALPLLAVSVPFAAALAEAEWVHWVLAAFAVIASASVVIFHPSARAPGFLVPAGLGIVLIVGALFVEDYGLDETTPTVIGGVLLAAAHLRRLFAGTRSVATAR